MRKFVEFLMDVTLLLVFILISSNYIETLPRYSIQLRETEAEVVKNSDKTLDDTAKPTITSPEKSVFLIK